MAGDGGFRREPADRTDAQITLFAMGLKGLSVVRALTDRFENPISSVFFARDSSVQNDYCRDIEALCRLRGIECAERVACDGIKTRYAFAVSWRWLIEPGSSTVIAFHDSLLPKYRGFNPLVSCLINGEDRIGVTALIATEKYDRGDVLGQRAVPVVYPMTIQAAIEAVSFLYAELAVDLALAIRGGEPPIGQAQDEAAASYSLWRDEEDYRIDWSRPASWIRRFVDSVGFPYRGALTRVGDRVVRVLQAEALPDVRVENRDVGKVIFVEDGLPAVVCGTGLLRIHELVDSATGESLLPLARFRTRLQ